MTANSTISCPGTPANLQRMRSHAALPLHSQVLATSSTTPHSVLSDGAEVPQAVTDHTAAQQQRLLHNSDAQDGMISGPLRQGIHEYVCQVGLQHIICHTHGTQTTCTVPPVSHHIHTYAHILQTRGTPTWYISPSHVGVQLHGRGLSARCHLAMHHVERMGSY